MSPATVGLLVFFIGLLAGRSESQCTYGSLRLVGGAGPWEGNVQICINNTWGWICHNGWRALDAQVACSQLGFNSIGATYRTYSYYGWPNASLPIFLDRLQCFGNESTLLDCPRPYAIGFATCNHNALAGVVCPNGGPPCTNQAIRLLRSQTWTPFNNRGRVEVCYNNQWGSVCDDYWGTNDAKVACAQLGFTKDGAVSSCCASFGQGYGPIWMDNLGCTSNENSLFSCSGNSLGSHNCQHSEDAGARCNGKITTSCVNGDLKLWRAYGVGPAHDGLALYCKSGQWTGVCDDSWKCDNGRLICQKLGYAGILNTRGEYHYGYYQGIDHFAWSCSSTHADLSQCSYYYHSSCNAFHDQLGIICYDPIIGSECTNGDVRLVNGVTPAQGRAEYCYEGFWYPLCQMSAYTALMICKHMGYNATAATRYNDQRFGRTERRSSLNYLNCSASSQQLTQCSYVRKIVGGCRFSVSKCGTEFGVGCHNQGSCINGQTRLADGIIEQEGRIEVCVNGIWGGICGGGRTLDQSDGYVVCKSLGFNGPSPAVLYDAYFSETDGPMLMNNVHCNGWENSIFDCENQIYPNIGGCAPQWSMGVICKDDCTNGDARLVGGDFVNEGTIEVCVDNHWSYIGDANFTDTNARVICNQLGYTGGNAMARYGSYYGKGKKPLKYMNVKCTGSELRLIDCPLTQLSFDDSKDALLMYDVAGVDCIYDVPTDPPCVQRPATYNTPGSECNNNGDIRLQSSGQQTDRGRLEYCYNGYWSPFCKLDPVAASVVCKQRGFTQYTWAAIYENNEFGASRNYSLFDNITCTGSETSISQCTVNLNNTCTPWCRLSNIGIRCFSPVVCTNGDVRLVDGFIDNEGRVEVCVNGVWGSYCDQGWDKTDAHVVCTQMGHPELEPIVFTNSTFGAGDYPIVYSNSGCGGWETTLSDCSNQQYPDFSCSRSNVAGVLCGYDCTDGDVRLVGSQWSYEGTVEICFNNLWGQISASGWSQQDAEVVCKQLGYDTQGTEPKYGSQYGKTNKTIHLTDVSCAGTEESINDCTLSILSLQEGKSALKTTDVAGVKCYTPNQCVPPPPSGGTSCTQGELRFTGTQSNTPEGYLQFCYNGIWSPFCELGPIEANVACRQLGYIFSNFSAVFSDARFGVTANTSLFQKFSCTNNQNAIQLTDCDLVDSCQSTCPYALGLRCYDSSSKCDEGAVRLVNGSYETEGRLEACTNNIWGAVCATGFDKTDAYVVCNELGLGDGEPTVYNSSYFGDGDGAIIYSNFGCRGFEASISDCAKQQYGSFSCSRNNVVGIKCLDTCLDGDVRLVGGSSSSEGTVQVCYLNGWGLISDEGWGTEEAQVVCRQLNYTDNPTAVTGSEYGKPNLPVKLTNVECTGSETTIDNCQQTQLSPDESQAAYPNIGAAGVKCVADADTGALKVIKNNPEAIGLGFLTVFLVISILITIAVVIYIFIKRKQGALSVLELPRTSDVTMSGLTEERGVDNPLAAPVADYEYDVDKDVLVNNMN